MHFSDILLGESSKYSEIFGVNYSSALKNLSTHVYKRKRYELFKDKKWRTCNVKINVNQLQVELHNHQAFTPYFKGELINQNGKLKIKGKFIISSVSISLAFLWLLIFLILTIKWFINPMIMEDGQFLPLFLLAGLLVMIYHKYKGHKKIKSLRKSIKSIVQEKED